MSSTWLTISFNYLLLQTLTLVRGNYSNESRNGCHSDCNNAANESKVIDKVIHKNIQNQQ